MSNQFGFIDIILLAMFAGFIILRLRNILGRKTGHQGKPMSKYLPKEMEILKDIKKNEAIKTNNVDEDAKKQFLKGAEAAYEQIITSFAKGDKKLLKTIKQYKTNQSMGDVPVAYFEFFTHTKKTCLRKPKGADLYIYICFCMGDVPVAYFDLFTKKTTFWGTPKEICIFLSYG